MRKAAIDLRFPRARPARWSRSTESRALRRETARPSTGHASAWVRPPSALWNSHEGARSDRAAAVQAGARTSVLSLSAQLLMGFGGGSVAIGAGIGLAAILAVGTVVLVSSRHHRRAQAEHYFGDQYTSELVRLWTEPAPYRAGIRREMAFLETAALQVEQCLSKPSHWQTTRIDQLLEQVLAFGGEAQRRIVAARMMPVLAQQIPDAFTRAQYVRMANVGGDGSVPPSGSSLQTAASILASRFGPLAPHEVMNGEAHRAAQLASVIAALANTSGMALPQRASPAVVGMPFGVVPPRTDVDDVVIDALEVLDATGGIDEDVLHEATRHDDPWVAFVALTIRGRGIQGALGQSAAEWIRTRESRVEDFCTERDRAQAASEPFNEDTIIAQQAAEMATAVLARAETTEQAQDAVALLVQELAAIYPGASTKRDFWLSTPILNAFTTLAEQHPDYFTRDDILDELQRMHRLMQPEWSGSERIARILAFVRAPYPRGV